MFPSSTTELGMTRSPEKPEQCPKAWYLICVTVSGMTRLPVKPVQPAKACSRISLKPFGRTKPVKPEHRAKAPSPMISKLSDSDKTSVPVNPLQPQNAPSGISVMNKGKMSSVNPLHSLNTSFFNTAIVKDKSRVPVKPEQP